MKKKILAIVLCIAMLATMVVSGTLAYFTDTDEVTNTFAVGNVKIEQLEVDKSGNPFEQEQKVYPIIDAGDKYNDPNYVWKKVSVKNTGSEDCYVRTFIAIPMVNSNSSDTAAYNNWLHWNASSASDGGTYAGNGWYWDADTAMVEDWPDNGGEWNDFETEIAGKPYRVFVATNFNILKPGIETGCNLRGFYLDSAIDCETLENGSLNYFYYPLNADGSRSEEKVNLGDISSLQIPVFSQAVQATGFEDENSNGTAADEAFAASGLPANPWASTT